MERLSTGYVFILGSLVILIITSMYYFFLPRFNYFEGEYTIYQPGNVLPSSVEGEYSVSNVYLISKYAEYLFMYLAAFVLAYFVCSKIERLKISEKYVWMHLVLTSISFILLIYLNPYIILPQSRSGYLGDLYVSGNYSQDQVLEGNKLILWYSSLQTPTSVIGIVLCVIGVVVFAVGTFGKLEHRR